MSRLDGKRAFVTGASRGIGRGIAEAYVAEGARVALAARSTDDLEAIADDLGEKAVPVECDVADADSIRREVETTVDAFGGLDVVVNNAGTITRNDLVDTSEADIERVVDVNLNGVMRVARETLPELAESDGESAMVNVSSVVVHSGAPGLSVYAASKGGVSTLTRQLALEHADDGVRVNAIAPGTVKTPINEQVREEDPSWVEQRREQVPLGRLGEVEDIADSAVFLASEEASYITGQELVVDGGQAVE